MDSDESYHSESEFYYPNEEDKENNAEETQQSFTMSDVQSYILEQRPKNTVKKTNSDLKTWKRYLKDLKGEREIEFIPSEELNLLMYRFFMDAKKRRRSLRAFNFDIFSEKSPTLPQGQGLKAEHFEG